MLTPNKSFGHAAPSDRDPVIPEQRIYVEPRLEDLKPIDKSEVINNIFNNWDINIADLIARFKRNHFIDNEARLRTVHALETAILEKLDYLYPDSQDRKNAKAHYLSIVLAILHHTEYTVDGWPCTEQASQDLGTTAISNLS